MKTGRIMNTHATQIIKQLTATDKDPYVIGIAGGSASGKSWFSNLLREQLQAENIACVILHQDDFAIGKAFKDKATSRYKWDDPANYRLDEAFAAALTVLKGETASFLAYTLDSHMPSKPKTISFGPSEARRKVLIVEGLFAWTHGFEDIVDEKVFLQTNFFHSFVLRLNRNISQNKTADFETVIRQYFTHVALAYYDLCVPMKETADLVVPNDVDVSTIEPSGQLGYTEEVPKLITVYQDASLTIGLARHTPDEYIIEITNPQGVLFREVISATLAERVRHYAKLVNTSAS